PRFGKDEKISPARVRILKIARPFQDDQSIDRQDMPELEADELSPDMFLAKCAPCLKDHRPYPERHFMV
ncbi:MAG TPA: hypothetical protein VF827_05120, partial [Syntrophales bacterium]